MILEVMGDFGGVGDEKGGLDDENGGLDDENGGLDDEKSDENGGLDDVRKGDEDGDENGGLVDGLTIDDFGVKKSSVVGCFTRFGSKSDLLFVFFSFFTLEFLGIIVDGEKGIIPSNNPVDFDWF